MVDDKYDLDDELEDDESESQDTPLNDDGATEEEDTTSNEEIIEAAASAQSSLAARNKLRESMQSEIEAFLAKGGKIQQVDNNVMGDPPKKPTSNYGSRPI